MFSGSATPASVLPPYVRTDNTVLVEEWLSLDPGEASARVPHILVVDEQNSLHG